jgi:hypothetical protein
LSAEHLSRVGAADEATLDRWADAIFDAATLDELLRG